jgi:MATE family multidrug resistance protein
MCLTAGIFLAVPRPLAAMMAADSRVVTMASLLIPIAGIFQVFDGGQAVGAGILRGIGDTRAPLIVMLASYWMLGVPLSAYLAFRTDMGPVGLWWGFVASLAAVAVFLAVRVRLLFGRSLERIVIE